MNVQQAYAVCEGITRREARNFSYGIRLLPGPKRRAMSAIYAAALSAADDTIDKPADELLGRYRSALAELFPAASATQVLDNFVTREPNATFRQQAGTGALRPPTATRWPGLALAGAWTGTGWPDTLEGAVRSGTTAAQYLGTANRDRRERQSVR